METSVDIFDKYFYYYRFALQKNVSGMSKLRNSGNF